MLIGVLGLPAQLDCQQKEDDLTGAEAIRRLVELGLSKPLAPERPQVPSTAKQGAARAAELAAKTIDNHIDTRAPPEEEEVRKRKLIQGPSAFHDASRKDRPGKSGATRKIAQRLLNG